MSTATPRRTRPASTRRACAVRHVLARIGRYVFLCLVLAFFALPLLWLATAPFDDTPTIGVSLPDFTLDNFRALLDNPYALTSLVNSVWLAGGTAVLVVTFAALAAYALSRVRVPGRDALLYGLLLLSSIVTGTATMVPLFELAFRLNLIDSRLGVILILTGGLLPAAIFILKDFMDATPDVVRGVGAGVRRQPAADHAAHRGAGGPARPGHRRGVGGGERLGQLPGAVPAAARRRTRRPPR